MVAQGQTAEHVWHSATYIEHVTPMLQVPNFELPTRIVCICTFPQEDITKSKIWQYWACHTMAWNWGLFGFRFQRTFHCAEIIFKFEENCRFLKMWRVLLHATYSCRQSTPIVHTKEQLNSRSTQSWRSQQVVLNRGVFEWHFCHPNHTELTPNHTELAERCMIRDEGPVLLFFKSLFCPIEEVPALVATCARA